MILDGVVSSLAFLGWEIIMFMLVPWERVKELLWVGIVGGFVLAVGLIYVMQEVLELWILHRVDALYAGGIPLFLAATWLPMVITFSYLMSRYREVSRRVLVLLAFPVIATAAHYFLVWNGMLMYQNWNYLYTFLLSLGIHSGITVYLYAAGKLRVAVEH